MPTSGCPIINLNNFKVIGINKRKQNNKTCNISTVIKWPIEEFKKAYKNSYKNNNNLNNDFFLKNINDLKKEKEEISYDRYIIFKLPNIESFIFPCSGKTASIA